jgi:HEAT repeat protein
MWRLAGAGIIIVSGCMTYQEQAIGDVIDWLKWKFSELDMAISTQNNQYIEKLQQEISKVAGREERKLIETLQGTDPEQRSIAAAAMGFTTNKKLVPHLVKSLSDQYSGVRKNSAAALGFLNDLKSSRDPLRKLLKDPDPKVRSAALYAFLHLLSDGTDRELVLEIGQMLSDPSDDVKIHAIQICSKIKSTSATPKLIELLRDPDPLVRINSSTALRELDEKNAIKPLIELLNDDFPNVQHHAYVALKKLSGKDIEMNYSRWRKWYDSQE